MKGSKQTEAGNTGPRRDIRQNAAMEETVLSPVERKQWKIVSSPKDVRMTEQEGK